MGGGGGGGGGGGADFSTHMSAIKLLYSFAPPFMWKLFIETHVQIYKLRYNNIDPTTHLYYNTKMSLQSIINSRGELRSNFVQVNIRCSVASKSNLIHA